MSNETNTPAQAAAAPMKLDVSVRPISPIDNLIGFANVTINDSFSVEGFRICSGDKGLYVRMPSQQDSRGNWRDTFKPITSEAHKQLSAAIIEGYSVAIEKMQATLDAARTATEKPSLSGALKENAGKVKNQPSKTPAAKAEPSR